MLPLGALTSFTGGGAMPVGGSSATATGGDISQGAFSFGPNAVNPQALWIVGGIVAVVVVLVAVRGKGR